MSTRPTQWRISRLAKNGVPLTRNGNWASKVDENNEHHRLQIEFRDALAAWMRENGYSGEIMTPWPIPSLKVEAPKGVD
jgi:hypothetical protein